MTTEVRNANDGNVLLSGIPDIPDDVSAELRPYQNTRYATFAAWAEKGDAIYISTRFADVPQLHRVDHPGGMRQQLTFDAEPVREALRQPNSSDLLLHRDVGGGEFYQLYLFNADTNEMGLLTDGVSRNIGPLWSPDGVRLAYTSTRRDGRSNDIWVMEVDDPDQASAVLAAPNGNHWAAAAWHPDGQRLLVHEYVSITDSRVHLLHLETGELVPLLGAEATNSVSASWSPIGFDPSGDGIFVTTDREGEFTRLAHVDLSSGGVRLIGDDIDWNVESTKQSADRAGFAFTTNENGFSTLYSLDPESLRVERIDGIPAGVLYGLEFGPDGSRLGFTFDSGIAPPEAYSIEWNSRGKAGAAELTRWTFSELGGLNPERFSAVEPIYFHSFDGLEIPAYLYRPAGQGPHPVIINIHGGPESQSRPVFSTVFQSWIACLGAAVISPNVRGSDGYGKSYLKLDNGMLREDSVRDIGALLDWVETQPDLDSNRVMVYGGSYGGYMVLASLIHFGDRLKAGVDIVGISDFITFLENTQDYRRDLRRVEYGDERDPEMRAHFEKISPLRNASRIQSPLFVVQGQNDPRVPVTEAEQIVKQVRAQGRPVWYMNALNEGHGYARKENQDLLRDAVLMFMREYLGERGSIVDCR